MTNAARRLLHFSMRAAGTKASLVKVLREEAGVSAVPNLPQQNLKTAVVVDAITVHTRGSTPNSRTFEGFFENIFENISMIKFLR